jgi:iron complex transport system ATP-binding protein
VGGALAIAGTALQGLFRNPLADPGIIGISAGASLGAVLTIYGGLAARATWALPAGSFLGAAVNALLVFAIAARRGRGRVFTGTLLLVGVALGSLAISFTMFILSVSLSSYDVGRQIMYWLLRRARGAHVGSPPPRRARRAPGGAVIVAQARELDALLLGELAAQSVGVGRPARARARRRGLCRSSLARPWPSRAESGSWASSSRTSCASSRARPTARSCRSRSWAAARSSSRRTSLAHAARAIRDPGRHRHGGARRAVLPGPARAAGRRGGDVVTALLEAAGVTFGYPGRDVLRDVSFSLRAGELVALAGPNGAGKSTLLRPAPRAARAARGQRDARGQPARVARAREIARRAALLPQEGGAHAPADSAAHGARGRGARPAAAPRPLPARGRRRRARDRARARGDGHGRARRAPHGRALGRRAASRSPGARPRQGASVLLLDEPVAGLDLAHQLQALDLLRATVDEGRAAIVALHDLSLAARGCDRILLLSDGALCADAPPAEVLTPEMLARVFAVRAEVRQDGAGRPFVVPISPVARGEADS